MQQVYTAIPSSDTDSAHQSGQPSFLEVSEGLEGTTGINITHKDRDTSLSFPDLKPSVNGKVTIGVGGKVDMEATEAVGIVFNPIEDHDILVFVFVFLSGFWLSHRLTYSCF